MPKKKNFDFMYPAIFTEIRLIHKKPLKTQLNTCMAQSATISRDWDWIDDVPFYSRYSIVCTHKPAD
jgi:hypothetical protein